MRFAGRIDLASNRSKKNKLEPNIQLRPRDKLLRDSFTPAEMMLFGLLLAVTTVTFWIGDPRSIWLLGSLLILGCLAPFILKTHERTHPFFIDLLWPRFWFCSAPAWIVLVLFTSGLTQNPLGTLGSEDANYLILKPISIWRPTSAADSDTWVTILGFTAAYVVSSLVFIIPKSRSFFERTLPWLCLSAVLVAVIGYIQRGLGLEGSLFTKGTGQMDFFAFFPYGGHWAAFAALWCSCCIAMAMLSTRYDDSPIFIHSIGPWYLTGGTLLGATGLLVGSPIPAAVLLLTLSAMLLIFTVDFLLKSTDIHRTTIAISSGISSCLCFSAGIYRLLQENELKNHAATLRSAAYEMFQASPIFGWGADAYGKILPFFSSDEFAGNQAERATSDLLQLAAEFGLVGVLMAVGYFLYFIIRYLIGQHDIQLTNHMLVGCFAVLVLSALDAPFMSPAVFFSFFVIFFSAMRWADLSRNNVDEVDAQKPQLVTPASERRIPFFTKPYNDDEK